MSQNSTQIPPDVVFSLATIRAENIEVKKYSSSLTFYETLQVRRYGFLQETYLSKAVKALNGELESMGHKLSPAAK